jgi:Fe2+ transport system protein FeoA/Mn-dependent DtxR family transcriptional regulator
MAGLTGWFWPLASALLAGLWLWTLLRQRRERSLAPSPHYQQVDAEDVLRAAYLLQEEGRLNADALARAASLPESLTRQALAALRAFGWVEEDQQGALQLTEEGVARARDLVRAHRLWERYLVDRERMSLDAVHAEAHRREHSTTREELERLDAELGHPAWDPHGHAIPGPKSGIPSSSARPLSEEAEPGRRFRIVALDDDPAPLLAQLVALGLQPGVDIEVVERGTDLLRLQVGGEGCSAVIPVARAAADRVSVVAAPALPLELGRLPVGTRARVVEIRGGGKHQRRMLDMGFVPGAQVTVMRKASLGDPIEYRVKGTGVAMRRADANSIVVEEMEDG